MAKNYKKLAFLVLIVVSLITVGSMILASKLNFNYDFEKFFPEDDPETVFYKEFREIFKTDNDYILVGIKNNDGIFNEEFLLRTDSLVKDLKNSNYITNVFSIIDSIEVRRGGLFGEPYAFPPLKVNNPEHYLSDSINIFNNQHYIGTLVSLDAKSLNIWINHDQFLSKLKCDTLADNLYSILDKYSFDEEHVVGRAIGQKVYIEMMQFEMGVFMTLSFILIVFFLYIAFRSVWGVIVPVFIVLLAIIWNLAAIQLMGNEIDLMLTILPTIIFVVGMSDAIHITTKYIDEIRSGNEKINAIKVSLKEVGLATLLTSVTTSIGFLSLVTSNIVPISQFGLNTAIGVIIAFLLSYSILPVVFYLMPLPKIALKKKRSFSWDKFLRPIFCLVIKKRRRIIALFSLFILISLYGISLVISDNFLLEDIREDHFLRKEIGFFEDNFSGARPLELALILDDNQNELNLELLKEMDKLENYLFSDFGLGSIASSVQIIKKTHQMYKGGDPKYYCLPDNNKELKKILKFFTGKNIVQLYINTEEGFARISGQTQDLGRRHFDVKITELNEFISHELSDARFEVKVTGTARLMDLNNERLAETMILGLILAFFVIAVIVGLLYRSIKMVFISLVPNILPLLFVGAVMGFAGITLKISTSIIFTIAFGIAVDDTIHFLSKFRIELAKGRSELYALKRTYLSTGKAIIVTTCILCGGFLTLLFSEFLGTYYIGLLIGLTLIFAVLADLVLLPVLILLFYKKK